MPEERPAWAATAAEAAEYRITGDMLIQAFTLDLEIHGDADAFRLLVQVREFLRQPAPCREAAREIDAWLERGRDRLGLCPVCGAVRYGNMYCRTCVSTWPDGQFKTLLLRQMDQRLEPGA